MNWVYYVKVYYLNPTTDKTMTTEFFTIANNYAAVAEQVQNKYDNVLIGFSTHELDTTALYVDDIEDFLNESREIFNG